jgi:hypothetical protein
VTLFLERVGRSVCRNGRGTGVHEKANLGRDVFGLAIHRSRQLQEKNRPTGRIFLPDSLVVESRRSITMKTVMIRYTTGASLVAP